MLPRREEWPMWKLVGTGSRRGASLPSRAGDVLGQSLVWAGFAVALSLTGPRRRCAASRADGVRAAKRAVMRSVTNRLVNPITRPLLEHGLWPRTQALLETTGRTSGLPRRVPVGNGLRGDRFWIVTEHGYAADYVKNIQNEPRVRVKVGRHWREGTAHILPGDDPLARLRWLRRPVNDAFLLLIGTQQLTIRIDLDP